MPKYEMEHQHHPEADDECLVLISMLTGHALEDVRGKVPPRLHKGHGWYGRDFIAAFRELGYDCSPKFKPFEIDTPYPCLMRYGPRKPASRKEDWWSVVVYYDGLVYDPALPEPFALNLFNPDYKITSMLQVWMSNL